MKKWLILLSVLFVGGGVTSAGLAGSIYFQDRQVYTQHEKEELNRAALNNIYVDTQMPINIEVTDGTPYVEFNQTYTDLIGNAVKYELQVEEKGDATYISLKRGEHSNITIDISQNEGSATLYLPKQAINNLTVERNGGEYWYGETYNLKNIDINNLVINSYRASIYLDGSYKNIDISGGNLVELKTNTLSTVKINGKGTYNLDGKFEHIDIDNALGDVNINSEVATEIDINTSGNINLQGNYNKIDIKSWGGTINVNSGTPYSIELEGDNVAADLNGAIQELSSEIRNGNITLNTIIVPDRIELDGNDNNIELGLPSNVPGFKVIYEDFYSEEDDGNNIKSEFELKEALESQDTLTYSYGNGKCKITLSKQYNTKLKMIDNGYTIK